PALSTVVLMEDDTEDSKPWDLPELQDTGVPWSDLDTVAKVLRVLVSVGKMILLLGFLYMFICSLDILSSAFQLIGVLTVQLAVPIIMGTNIGTSVTNTLVAMTQAGQRNTFRSVTCSFIADIILICSKAPLLDAALSNTLLSCADIMLKHSCSAPVRRLCVFSFFSLTKLDHSIISGIATGHPEASNKSLIKKWCRANATSKNVTVPETGPENCTSESLCWVDGNDSVTTINISETYKLQKCRHLFADVNLPDMAVGLILLALSLLALCSCLVLIVKLLNSMLKGQVATVVKQIFNTDFPFPFGWVTGYIAIVVGAGMTFVVQSSSVFTSCHYATCRLVHPKSLEFNYFIASSSFAFCIFPFRGRHSKSIALVHFLFNISGILLWYPVPFTRIPIRLAKGLGNVTASYRWFAFVYVTLCFFLLPIFVFSLSLAGCPVLIGVGAPLVMLLLIILLINLLQKRKVVCLPPVLRSWDFLPLWAHSLDPWDKVVDVFTTTCCCCCKCCH
ncbi:unnamed protein product, partial [Tetraodon nigroviridis]